MIRTRCLSRLILCIGLSFGFLATLHTPAQAQSQQQLLQSAAYYDQLASRTTGTSAQRYREAAAIYRQLAARAGTPTPRPPQIQPAPVQPTQPATRTEYRSTAYERYIYQDRHGRRYWSGWRSAGSMQNVSRDSVQRQINGWIEGDIQRRRGLVSRKADPITTVQVRGNP